MACALALLGLVVALYDRGHDHRIGKETISAARVAIARLPYDITTKKARRDLLIGEVHSFNDSFRFLLYVGASGRGPLGRAGDEGGSVTEAYSIFTPIHVRGETKRAEAQRLRIQYRIEEALCRQATQASCPP